MSLDSQVRFSDILSKEQEMDKTLETANSNGVTTVEDKPTMSVKDARKRFEQMTASASSTPTRSTVSGNITSGSRTAPRPAIKKQKPLEKSESVPPATTEKKTKAPIQKAKTDTVIGDRSNDKHSAVSAVVNHKGESSKAPSKLKSFKKLNFVKRKQSNLATKVTRASSDAEILENKNKHRLSKSKAEEPKSKGASRGSSTSNSPISPRKSPSHSLTASASAPTTPKSSKKLKVQGFSLLSRSKGDSSKKSAAEGEEKEEVETEEAVNSSPSHQAVEMDEGGETPKGNGETKTKKRPESPRVIKDGEYKITLAEGTDVTGSKLKVILDKQLACLAGGLEDDKHPIVTIPDVGLKQLDSDECFDELCVTLLYIKTLLSIEHLSAGVTLLLDARNSKTHGPAKHLLERIASQEFPLFVHMVYIYIKTGLFSRSKQLASPDLSSKLNLAYLHDQKELLEHLEEGNVSVGMGGVLNYDHRNWVYSRIEYEKVQRLYSHAISSVPQVTKALDLFEVPESVKDAEHLMQEDLKLKENLVNKIAEAELLIDQFLENLKGQRPDAYKEVSLDIKAYIAMMSSLNSMLQELRADQGKFDSFWTVHKARVDHMMRMCHFTRSAQKLKCLMQGHIDDLTGGGVILGDTLESALELGEKHEAFVTKCKTTMDDHMSKIRKDGNSLINPKFAPSETEENMHSATKQAIETVKAKLTDLSETYHDLMSMCQQKRDLFIVCVKFHMTSRQVQQWNQDVLEFLAQQPYEEPTQKVAIQLLADIDGFLGRIQPSQIATMTELSNALPKEKQFKKQAQKTAQKYEQTHDLLENRKVSLLKIMAFTNSPAQTQKSKSKKAKSKHEIELVNGGGDGVTTSPSSHSTSSSSLATTNPEASLYLAKALTNESAEDFVDGETDSGVLKRRQFVYKELIDTEQVYVKDLQTVLDAYYDSMAPDDLSVPLRLRGKRETVFGNLMEIYMFHDTVFRKALERYADHPERVGECFTQFNSEFQMYTNYCKNRTASEALVNECTESEAFFKGIQMRLAHQLSLSAYLLKPVQRITKYQLLLKDMMKHSVNAGKAHTDLQSALDRMLKVLKNLNDSLHVVGLKGFPGSLAEQGRLLVHDLFQLLEGSIGGRSLFSRARERHVFLFEKVIIFSKKVEAPVQRRDKKSDTYLYKGHLEMADIALRKDTQPTQFELTVHGQHKLYKFQAQSKEIQEMWTAEISRLLQLQFMLMKDMVIKSGTLDRRTYKGKAKLSRDTRLFGDSFKRHNDVQPAKKSISGRFNILKRRKGSDQQVKKSTSSSGIKHESPLLVSCSLPPSVKHSIAGGARSPKHSGFSLSNIETGKSQEDLSFNDKYSDSISSDEELSFSNDEDDEDDEAMVSVDHYETLAPGAPCYYVAIAEYNPGESDEIGIDMFEGQEVEVIGINKYGWWWVRATSPSTNEKEEGWVPASYLKLLKKIS